MKIDRIHYEELFPTGIYANQRLRIEATVDENDNTTECYQTLKTHVQQAFQALNPNLEEMKGTHVLKVPQEPPNMNQKELDSAIEQEFNELKERIVATTSKAAAGQLLMDSSFKHNMELKQLVNNKTE